MVMDLTTCLVLNPLSGGRRADRLRRDVERAFREIVPGGQIRETAGPGDAETLVRSLIHQGVQCVAVAGGDGTINEAVNGYFVRPRDPADDEERCIAVNPEASLAVIPMGTGGDFRRSLGLEPDPLAALSLLTGTSTRPCDVGRATFVGHDGQRVSRYFVNITSFGLPSLVVQYVNTSGRRVPGSMNYFVSTLRAFMNYEPVRIRILMDRAEQRVEQALLVAVANGRFFGGGMEIAPGAEIRDGLLDVVLVADASLGDFMAHATKLYGGRILEHPQISHRHVREVLLDPVEDSDVMLLEMDGEPLGRLPATLRVMPGALRLKS